MSTLRTPDIEAVNDGNGELASLLKAAGDPLRLEIMRLLGQDSLGVMELSRIFNVKQSGMSHHLKVLASANLVVSRREGNSIFYRRALPQEPSQQLVQALFGQLDAIELSPQTRQGLIDVQRERAKASEEFFSSNASKFREQQDLIASYPVYADTIEEMLDNTELSQQQTALEIGPGEGEFLLPLSKRFDRVVALDTSASMLLKAQSYGITQGLHNVDYIHGDTQIAREQSISADCVVLNMVLHHTPSPSSVIQDSAAMLKPGGALLLTDLCHHDQQWAMEACGDLWLGFDPEDLANWALQAGLSAGQSQFIALRNGFQIQVRQFFKPVKEHLSG